MEICRLKFLPTLKGLVLEIRKIYLISLYPITEIKILFLSKGTNLAANQKYSKHHKVYSSLI